MRSRILTLALAILTLITVLPRPAHAAVIHYTQRRAIMRRVGIPNEHHGYANQIVRRESSWNTHAVNPSSGACGLAQAYPCSKLGPLWFMPEVALKWQHGYVENRYGGYPQAYRFWQANKWY
jgi:resuscitation-promoting factor RpfB